MIIDFGMTPIAFLHMKSEREGFVVEYTQEITFSSTGILFAYHQIIKKGGLWHKKILFSFTIPSTLLCKDSQNRLYESLLPLMPRIINQTIYFVDSMHDYNGVLKLYSYDLNTAKIKEYDFVHKHINNVFVPMVCDGKLIHGGEFDNFENLDITSFLT